MSRPDKPKPEQPKPGRHKAKTPRRRWLRPVLVVILSGIALRAVSDLTGIYPIDQVRHSEQDRQDAVVVSTSKGDQLRVQATGPGPIPVGDTEPVRLISVGIDDCYQTSAARQLARLAPRGIAVELEFDAEQHDGETWLAYVWAEDHMLNRLLVSGGYATAYRQGLNTRHLAQLRTAETNAWQARRGLWEDCWPS